MNAGVPAPGAGMHVDPEKLRDHAKRLLAVHARFGTALAATGQVSDATAFGLVGDAVGLGLICAYAQTAGEDSIREAQTAADEHIKKLKTWAEHVDWQEEDVKKFFEEIEL